MRRKSKYEEVCLPHSFFSVHLGVSKELSLNAKVRLSHSQSSHCSISSLEPKSDNNNNNNNNLVRLLKRTRLKISGIFDCKFSSPDGVRRLGLDLRRMLLFIKFRLTRDYPVRGLTFGAPRLLRTFVHFKGKHGKLYIVGKVTKCKFWKKI